MCAADPFLARSSLSSRNHCPSRLQASIWQQALLLLFTVWTPFHMLLQNDTSLLFVTAFANSQVLVRKSQEYVKLGIQL